MTKKAAAADNTEAEPPVSSKLPTCGIVMPISPIDGCEMGHWQEVRGILEDAISTAGFIPNLVSDANESGVIQQRIIKNLYQNEMVICDISGKNANVMLELGVRLAFDKPTIILKDSSTSFSFDISPIEHLIYPRDLRFGEIVKFKNLLAEKITATYKASKNDPNYKSWLNHFGDINAVQIEQKEITPTQAIADQLRILTSEIASLKSPKTVAQRYFDKLRVDHLLPSEQSPRAYAPRTFKLSALTDQNADKLISEILPIQGVWAASHKRHGDMSTIVVDITPYSDLSPVVEVMLRYASHLEHD
ncbi:MAG: hypothetical protein AAGC78_04070 [Cellvibrio sp.]|uniref:hypothetical protein n=1 Tax=Cellvibrio sp. TaxID=1965322 RepID=UPI0031A9DC32